MTLCRRCAVPAPLDGSSRRGSAALFEARVADNHLHIVCRVCGTVADVDCLVGSAPCLEPSPTTGGFVIDEAEVTFWGVCPDCKQSVS